ncbi:MAG: cystathionine gamma-synthase [Rhodothermales bacterium]|jgi:cystathionine gamma-synthase
MDHIETLLATAGCLVNQDAGAVTPPIHTSTTFDRATDGTYESGFVYSRNANPTRTLFEETLARLEGAEGCAAFSSGMAACNTVISALCPGGHLLLPEDVYHGVRHLAGTTWRQWGLETSVVDYSADWEQALRPNTSLIWMETPSNPLVRITDVQAISARARELGIPTVVDSTWNTPLLLRPLDLGATIVVHSTTKYLAGHSDVLGGAALTRDAEVLEKIRHVQTSGGAVMDPFSAWLTLRGMRSLGPRMNAQCTSAARVAEWLANHREVETVHYPGLATHPLHEVASRQMSRFGGMLSFEVGGGRPAAMAVAGRLKTFRRATSLGGTESLVEHRASIEPEPPTSPEGLLRLSVGLEHIDDLLQDLETALTPF